MADLPILFSAPMIRALLDGRKTQTRRILKPQPTAFNGGKPLNNGYGSYSADGNWRRLRYAVGDRLWVRESCFWVSGWGWRYRADNDDLTEKRAAGEVSKLTPSIHMPRRASRITLTVTDVRVQRLQDCSEADAVAEGICADTSITDAHNHWVDLGGGDLITGWDAREVYASLWNHINGPGAWEANPWVAAYTFTVTRGNIDQLGAR